MSLPKPRADWVINVPTVISLCVAVMAIGAQLNTLAAVQAQAADLELRVRAIEGPVIERLARIEEQNRAIIRTLETHK